MEQILLLEFFLFVFGKKTGILFTTCQRIMNKKRHNVGTFFIDNAYFSSILVSFFLNFLTFLTWNERYFINVRKFVGTYFRGNNRCTERHNMFISWI